MPLNIFVRNEIAETMVWYFVNDSKFVRFPTDGGKVWKRKRLKRTKKAILCLLALAIALS